MVTGVRSAAIPGCDPGVPGLRMRRTASGRGRAGTGQGACVAAPGSHWLPRAGGRGLQRGASSARASASQPGSWSPRRGVGVLRLVEPNRSWGSGSRQQPGRRRLALRPCEVRARRCRSPPPPRGRAVPSLPGLRASRASTRCSPPGPDPPTSPDPALAEDPRPHPSPLRTAPPAAGAHCRRSAGDPFLPQREPQPGPPVTARCLSRRRWTRQTAVPGPAPLSGPIEAVCPPWEPEVGSCPHLPAVPC